MGSLFRRISGKAARAKKMRFEQISYQAAFSLLLLNDKFEALEFLVLSQAPDGSAALRQVNHESNKDLRLRCEPRLEPLLTLLRARQEQPA